MPTTPLEPAPPSLAGDRRLFLKREDVHELGAFKWRGALPVLTEYRDAGVRTVVTASTGNHGAATAWAAEQLGMEAIVYAPEGASEAKLGLIRALGADMRIVGMDFDVAKAEARRYADAEGFPVFEDGAEPAQYEGYAAIADEILDALDEPPGAIVVPLGNGALLGGIARRAGERAPETLRVGVAAKEAPVMVQSWRAGTVVESDRAATFADGLSVRVAIPRAVELLNEVVNRMLLVSERAMAHAVGTFAEADIRVEGAAGAALAALPQLGDVDGAVVLIVTGRNIDDELHERAVTRPETFPD